MTRGWACVCRLGGVGDNLIAAATLLPLKRLGYNVEVITSPNAQAVFINNPHIDKISVKRDQDIPQGEAWQVWFESRSHEYDIFVNLSHSCEGRHALHKSAAAFWWRPEYRRKLCAGSYLDTVCDIVGVRFQRAPLFYPTVDELERASKVKHEQIGGGYIAWVISGSRIDKIYPYAAMAIARIIKEIGKPVVMVGAGTKQFEYAKQIQEHVARQNGSDKDLHLALSPDGSDPGGNQNWPLRRSLTQTLVADAVVTPDTGFGWAVAMEPMRKVVLLSHASAENITTHWINTRTLHADPEVVSCFPCHRLHDDISTCTPNKDGGHAAACMSDIGVPQILDALAV